MKLVILLLVSVTILSSNLFSQAIPMQISYQGVLKDAAGNVLNGDFTITFRIYNDAVGGSALWNENQSVSVANGLFNIQLGSVTPITTVPFDRIQFLGITVGTGSELSPRTLLSPTPYSFMSMDILDNAITTNKLQNGAVTVDKIAPGITDGQVLTTVSGNVLWQTSTSGVFTLPYSGNVSSTSPAFALTNVGTGPALYGLNNNSAALFGQTIGGVVLVLRSVAKLPVALACKASTAVSATSGSLAPMWQEFMLSLMGMRAGYLLRPPAAPAYMARALVATVYMAKAPATMGYSASTVPVVTSVVWAAAPRECSVNIIAAATGDNSAQASTVYAALALVPMACMAQSRAGVGVAYMARTPILVIMVTLEAQPVCTATVVVVQRYTAKVILS